jgi:hypothetical protein
MSKRLVLSSLVTASAVAVGTIVHIASADAAAPGRPEISRATARFTPSAAQGSSTLTFTATVADDSGVRNARVLAWPAASHLAPTAHDMRAVEKATCEATSTTTSTCAYTVKSRAGETADLPEGAWYVSVLATAQDGDATFVPEAAAFTVTH